MSDETQATPSGLHVVVTGATGNVGTAVVRALGEQPTVSSVLGVARRETGWTAPKTRFEHEHPHTRVVRLRPGFIFQHGSASAQRRIFGGPFVPGSLVRAIPVVPAMPGLSMQVVHADDVADAYVRAVLRPVRGAFNIAAEPPVDAHTLADLLGARVVPVRSGLVRSAAALAWHTHLTPAEPGLFDTVLRLPLMDCTRARSELGWSPVHAPTEVLREFVDGLRSGAGLPTPPLAPDSVRDRMREVATGVGART
ncbi:hypothetical protein ACWDTG_07250 [Rhodococcus zopfii]|uniref:hypothetical protein n=1 Tax=Rhodococcus zopfii TaxID=43772 RepID=UPI0011111C8D|nr:hypothetical protein [Rhodococcus zopfii]